MKIPSPKESTFLSDDGLTIFYRRWRPVEVQAVFIVVHGLGEHSGRYFNPVYYFTPRGIALYALDHRGHGRSTGKRGHISRFDEFINDLRKFILLVQEKEKDKKLFLPGHSMGGLISLAYTLRYPDELSGVIVSSPALKVNIKVSMIKTTVGRLVSNLFPAFTMGNEIHPHLLSHDPEVARTYLDDPLVHNRVSARFFTEFMKAMDETIQGAHRLTLPCLVLQAGGDELVAPEGSREFFERVELEDKQFRMYDGFYHELFNEVEKEKVFRDIEEWITPRF